MEVMGGLVVIARGKGTAGWEPAEQPARGPALRGEVARGPRFGGQVSNLYFGLLHRRSYLEG